MSRRHGDRKRRQKEIQISDRYYSLQKILKKFDVGDSHDLEARLKVSGMIFGEKEIPIKLSHDKENKRYIPYCDYGYHQQILSKEKEGQCISRECRHYQRLYIQAEGFFPKDKNGQE